MNPFRRVTLALLTIAALVAATPVFAQDTTTPSAAPLLSLKAKNINFGPASFVSKASASTPTRTRGQEEQGLGVFLQGGWVRVTTYGAGGSVPSFATITGGIPGFVIGIGFGGNKSGHFGIGADINYIVVGVNNAQFFSLDGLEAFTDDLKLHYLQVPIYGRITFFGTSTKNAPSLYALLGGYIDILLKASLGTQPNVRESFNGFDLGLLAGAGFEVVRIGIEARLHWALRQLQSTGVNHNGTTTFLNGLEDSKKLTFILLFKIRLN
jgi:hypothetical protein